MDTAFTGLTSCRLITITGRYHSDDAVCNRHLPDVIMLLPRLLPPRASQGHLSPLGGFDSEFAFFSRGDVSIHVDMIVLESVLLWESASLAGRAIQELWLLRAGQMALTSLDPFEATLSALRHGRPQPRD